MVKIDKRLPALLKTIAAIKRDCDNIEKNGNLTEYGAGQLDLIRIILAELE